MEQGQESNLDAKREVEKPAEVSQGFEETCAFLRGRLEETKAKIASLFKHQDLLLAVEQLKGPGCLRQTRGGEALANLTLVYRHLEDARMRLGKAMQAMQGGVSILDKPERKRLSGLSE